MRSHDAVLEEIDSFWASCEGESACESFVRELLATHGTASLAVRASCPDGTNMLEAAIDRGFFNVAASIVTMIPQEGLAGTHTSALLRLLSVSKSEESIRSLGCTLMDSMTDDDLNLRDKKGRSAFHWAVAAGSASLAEKLIARLSPGCLSDVDDMNMNALHVFASAGLPVTSDVALLDLLTRHAPQAAYSAIADTNEHASHCGVPLAIALENRECHSQVAEAYVDATPVSSLAPTGGCDRRCVLLVPLTLAASQGNGGLAERMLRRMVAEGMSFCLEDHDDIALEYWADNVTMLQAAADICGVHAVLGADDGLRLLVRASQRDCLEVCQWVVDQSPPVITKPELTDSNDVRIDLLILNALHAQGSYLELVRATGSVGGESEHSGYGMPEMLLKSLELTQWGLEHYPEVFSLPSRSGEASIVHHAARFAPADIIVQLAGRAPPGTLKRRNSDGLTPYEVASRRLQDQESGQSLPWISDINLAVTTSLLQGPKGAYS